eukprot:8871636-Heterocapsa_arctica.AAC.1
MLRPAKASGARCRSPEQIRDKALLWNHWDRFKPEADDTCEPASPSFGVRALPNALRLDATS